MTTLRRPSSFSRSTSAAVPLVGLRKLDDLKVLLTRQKLITRQAALDLAAIVTNDSVQNIEGETEENQRDKALTIMLAEAKLLDHYSKWPTFTEYNAMPPKKAEAMKWGATFGVAVIVGELILEQVRQVQGQFENALLPLYVILLAELADPKHEFMIEPLELAIRMDISDKSGKKIPVETQQALKRQLVRQLAETFALVSTGYGIMGVHEGGAYSLTPTGLRVLLHLKDAQRFVLELSAAHKRFQEEKPKLSVN